VQLPAIGSVFAQGLSLAELKQEIEHRYAGIVTGVEVTPILAERAPRFVYVVGEVREPGRFQLDGPTTAMQAISLAGSWTNGAKLESVVVLRRDENWNLMATRLNLRDALFGRQPCPPDEIWLRDGDVVIVPKTNIQWTGDLIELFFTRGIYGVLPIGGSVSIGELSVL
jgi:polysaccharide export outer membrane protein